MATNDEKVLVVAGRAPDIAAFIDHVRKYVFDNFNLAIATPVENDIGVDGKVRFIAFINGVSLPDKTIDNQALVIRKDTELGAVVYADMPSAMEGAKARYGFDSGSDALAEKIERIREISERFPTMTASEIEFASTYEALMAAGRLTLIRGLIEDRPICCWAHIIQSEDEAETKCIVYSVLVTSPGLAGIIELPFNALEE